VNGKQHGKGIYITVDGKRREGEWVEGKRIKWTGAGEGDEHGDENVK